MSRDISTGASCSCLLRDGRLAIEDGRPVPDAPAGMGLLVPGVTVDGAPGGFTSIRDGQHHWAIASG
jgi:hypothetical protein